MAKYVYTARLNPNKTIQGNIEAESEQDAVNKLSKIGYFPIAISPELELLDKKIRFGLRKISNKEIAVFTRQLATLVESGVAIIDGLNIILNQTTNKYLKAAIGDMVNKIKDGSAFSDSISAHPYLFSNVYSSMLRAGEVSGNLHISLRRLADFLEKEEEFKSSLGASLTYPIFVSVVGILTVAVLLVFVMPRLLTMFADMGQELPLPTRLLIGSSNFLRGYWWFIFAVILIIVMALSRFYHTPRGKVTIDKFKLGLFVFGPIILKSEISRLMRSLSLLTSSGINIIPSLDVSVSAINNQILKEEVQRFKERITEGLSFSKCLEGSKLFYPFIINIITVGEETGTLERSFLRIAEEYEREVDNALKAMSRLLEPVIILVMGLVVGFIVLAMLLPIFQINFAVR